MNYTLHTAAALNYDSCKAFENGSGYSPDPENGIAASGSSDIVPLSKLNLTHTFMFAKVMTDPEILKEFLQIVLDIRIKRIEPAQYERTFLTTPESKSIRLDIYADDDSNRKYCVEMQGYVEYNIAKRSRYYQSVIDIDSLFKGHSYKDLSNVFVIFICTYDPFRLGMQKYVFEKRCVNAATELPLNDGVSTIILADNDGDPVINEFYSYAKNSTKEEAARCSSKLVQLLSQKVEKVRFDPLLEVEYLRFEELQREKYEEGYDLGISEGRASGIAEGKIYALASLVRDGLLTLDDAAKRADMSAADFEAASKKLS